ncbi:MAG: Uma2 family endonuclease [Lewinellaceae bacterium]|nr:Uma2 family endonuclease [Lewinellaceae bacterium]
MQATKKKKEEQAGYPEIPSYLIYEVLDGKPVYYRGYKDVLAKTKTLEEIMGSSALQAEIISYLLKVCYLVIDTSLFRIYTNEIGSHVDKRNNLSNDIAIFDKKALPAKKVTKHYPDVPAKFVFEVDLDGELGTEESFTEHEYIHTKVQKMLDFGVEKVFWITTKTQKVLAATPGQNWEIIDWNKDIELFQGHAFNIGHYLEEEGIELA